LTSLSLERRSEQRLNVVEITRNRELAGLTARQTRHESNLTPRVPRAVHTSPVLTPRTRVSTRSLSSHGELLGRLVESNTYISPLCTTCDNTCYGLHRNRYLREIAFADSQDVRSCVISQRHRHQKYFYYFYVAQDFRSQSSQTSNIDINYIFFSFR